MLPVIALLLCVHAVPAKGEPFSLEQATAGLPGSGERAAGGMKRSSASGRIGIGGGGGAGEGEVA